MNNRERRILVTGATGTVGSEVVKQLASISSSSDYNNIRAAVHTQNKVDKLEQYVDKGVEIVSLDYTKPETISNALDKVDKLFLQTLPIPDVTDISSNFVKEAKKKGVKFIVKLSAMGADSEPTSTILRLHGMEEKIIQESGIPYIFLRPSAFMQNFVTQFGHTIKTQNTIFAPAGNSKMSFIDVRDIAAMATMILNNNGIGQQHQSKAYDITGPQSLSYSHVAEILSNEIGRKIRYIDLREEDARKALKEIDMNEWIIDVMMELYSITRAGYGSQTTSVVEDLTGRKPISFTQFAKDYVNVFRLDRWNDQQGVLLKILR